MYTIVINDVTGDVMFAASDKSSAEFACLAYIVGIAKRNDNYDGWDPVDEAKARRFLVELEASLLGINRLPWDLVQIISRLDSELGWSCGPMGDPSFTLEFMGDSLDVQPPQDYGDSQSIARDIAIVVFD